MKPKRKRKMKVDKLEQIIETMKKNSFTNLKYENDDTTIELNLPSVQRKTITNIVEPVKEVIDAKSNYIEVKSKLVGRFYSTLTSDKVPTLRINDEIKKGENLCMIESMNIEHIVKSEHDGVLKEVLLGEGDMVMYGQVIMRIEN